MSNCGVSIVRLGRSAFSRGLCGEEVEDYGGFWVPVDWDFRLGRVAIRRGVRSGTSGANGEKSRARSRFKGPGPRSLMRREFPRRITNGNRICSQRHKSRAGEDLLYLPTGRYVDSMFRNAHQERISQIDMGPPWAMYRNGTGGNSRVCPLWFASARFVSISGWVGCPGPERPAGIAALGAILGGASCLASCPPSNARLEIAPRPVVRVPD